MNFEKILVPTDFSESARYALPFAVDLAKKYGAKIHLLHVVEPIAVPVDFAWGTYSYPDIEKQLSGYVENTLDTIVKEDIPKDLTVQQSILHGKSWREIITFAKENELDLIVMATHGLSGFSHALYGSTAEKVIRKAPCPVLTIRHPEVKFEMP
ncbi:MAG: universal stress protein [Candidatus Marinimicrobia bacterium]|nr:universal stress protein [Candidatus Neomarinimicrobiota bacterium]MCF7851437.1 universal stress protein [Candidatus Neomarinimicrobiota bacterium]MCF7905293.1 universal stress protein [Candidatus Neomarinimicrobiota bacterium]